MLFKNSKYRIIKQTDRELVISVDVKYVFIEIAVTIFACLLLYFLLWHKIDLNKIDIVEISLGLILLTTVFRLFTSLKLVTEGEIYTFSKSLNSITKNGRKISPLSNIDYVDIIEKPGDNESPTEYELKIQLENNISIRFQKTTNLKFQKTLGKAICKISGAQFKYLIKLELQKQQELEQKENDLKPYIKIFEKKFEGMSEIELEAILKDDSPYAEYARRAARNLLDGKLKITSK